MPQKFGALIKESSITMQEINALLDYQPPQDARIHCFLQAKYPEHIFHYVVFHPNQGLLHLHYTQWQNKVDEFKDQIGDNKTISNCNYHCFYLSEEESWISIQIDHHYRQDLHFWLQKCLSSAFPPFLQYHGMGKHQEYHQFDFDL